MLLGILFYANNLYRYWTANGVIFPMVILVFISYDLIAMYFPRRLALVTMILIVLVLCWMIFYVTFVNRLQATHAALGIFGEDISYCTIKRLICKAFFR